jgi:hypothetical protein
MLPEEEGPAEAAIDFTDKFVEGGVAKLDALFGAGYAKANPQSLAAYIGACASNLNAFMTAAAAMPDDGSLEEAAAAFEEELRRQAEAKPKRRWRP